VDPRHRPARRFAADLCAGFGLFAAVAVPSAQERIVPYDVREMPLRALDPEWAGPPLARAGALAAAEPRDRTPPPLFSTRPDPLAHLPLAPGSIADAARPAERPPPVVVKAPRPAKVEVAPGPTPPAVVEEAETLDAPAPAYPRQALRKRQEGTVVLLADVRADGTVEKARVESSSGFPLLDDAALDAVERWRFKPRVVSEGPRAFVARVPFKFSITRGGA
jgi:protein TonB